MTGRLKLRPTVHCAPVRGGVFFANWTDSFVISGPPSLYALVELIGPLLEQGATSADIVASLPEGRAREVAPRILQELDDHGMLLHQDELGAADLSPELVAAFAGTIGHLEGLSRDPYAAFSRFRAARVGVTGAASVIDRAVRALTTMGVERVEALPPHELDGTTTTSQLADQLDLLVHAGVEPDRERFAAVIAAAQAAGIAVIEGLATECCGVVCGGPAGPERHPSMADVIDRLGERAASGFPHRRVEGPPSPVLAALVGNLVAHRAFRALTGLSGTGPAEVALVDADSLRVSLHPLLPLRVADRADPPLVEEPDLSAGLATVTDEVLERAAILSDGELGLVGPPTVHGLDQTSVFTTRIALDSSTSVLGFGMTEGEARYRATVEAIRALVSRIDPEPSCTPAVGLSLDACLVDGMARALLSEWLGSPRRAASVAFRDVADPVARLCWKSMAVRFGRRITVDVERAFDGAGPWFAVVEEGGRALSAAYGATREAALRDSLVVALGLVQARAADTLEGPRIGGWLHGPPVHGLVDEEPAKAPELLVEIEAAMDPRTAVTHRSLGDHPVARRTGLHLGWIRLTHDG